MQLQHTNLQSIYSVTYIYGCKRDSDFQAGLVAAAYETLLPKTGTMLEGFRSGASMMEAQFVIPAVKLCGNQG